ncbi:hypothetical protein VB780_08890 [Leptolyngbya sp. CCNP1308]|uniref:hypothetical protein n=1 Tax=Leptolyngbya sp. CCNP1308 TaxID=3110255 RepID=UPI002B1FE8A4|nr:hypothetical protein [Leptolyngbya sp. CCNP1308]MEA5448679.1 hypothetical protein [Leptolyngbya sp. CCNP1308]
MHKLRPWIRARLLRQAVVAGLALLLVVLTSPALPSTSALAQFLPIPSSSGSSEALPVNVERSGKLEAAWVQIDGQELFRIASPAVFNRAEVGSQLPVEMRARQVEANLQRLFPNDQSSAAPLNPETLEVVVKDIDNYPVLFAQDASLAEPRVLLTVTDADVQYHSAPSKQALAE